MTYRGSRFGRRLRGGLVVTAGITGGGSLLCHSGGDLGLGGQVFRHSGGDLRLLDDLLIAG